MAMTLEPSLQPEHCATLLLLPLCAPVVSGFLWFPAPGALGLGACVVCFVGFPLLGSPCACPSFVFSAWLLAAPAVVPCFPVSCAVALCCRVVLCCRALLSFCGAVDVCFALLRPVVRRLCGLRCCWCLVLWRVPMRCGVSLSFLRCGGAALVCRGVLLCCALSCGVLRPVPCPAVPCCPAVLCWLAVLCGCLRCWCLFSLLSSFPLLKTPAVFPCLSDLGGDPSDDEPPSMTSASPSEDDDPEDPENPIGEKKKKKSKTRRPEGCRSQEAEAIATSKIVVNLPEFTGKDLSEFAENFGRFLQLTGQTHASGRVKCDLLLQCCKTKYLEKQVRQIMTMSATFADVLVALERQYPTYETELSIRAEIQNLPVLPNNPKPGRVSELLADLDHWAGRLMPGSYSSDDLLFWLMAKLPRELWDECRSTAEHKARSLRYKDLCVLLLELALEKESDQHLNNYRPEGGGSGNHGKGYQGSRPGQGTTPKHAHARIMENVKELFWCDAGDEQGHLQHAPDCEQRDCFVVQGKQQEKNTGAKAKLPDHYRCTITCAFCGKRKHYEDECYHKHRLSAKLKGEDPGKGSGKGRGKGKGNDSGKGKSKGRGQAQDKSQGGRGGGANRQPDKDNKNTDKNGGNPNPNPGGNSELSGGQSGPTTRSQMQAHKEQGAKREHQGGDDGNAKKRSRFMRMARKLRNKGLEVTCPAEF